MAAADLAKRLRTAAARVGRPAKAKTAVLGSLPAGAGSAASRAQRAAAGALLSWLLLGGLALGFSACAAAGGAAAFFVAAAVTALALHLLAAYAPSAAYARTAAIALAVLAVLAATVLPPLQAGLFSFGNEVISRFDDTFGAYAALLPVRAESALSQLFYVAAGIAAATAAWALVERRAVTVLTLLAFSLMAGCLWLKTGQAAGALALGMAGWLPVWRASMSRAPLRVLPVLGSAAAALAVAGIAWAAVSAYQPLDAIDSARQGVAEAVQTARFGTDTLPEGDLAEASSMNEGSEGRLQVTASEPLENDLYLRGFVGAAFTDGAWQPLGHTAYEGSWTGLFGWLSGQGLAPGTQRAAFDDESAAQQEAGFNKVTVSVQAAGANRAYVYAPASLRELDGAGTVSGRDGSALAAGLLGAGSYTMTIDDVNTTAEGASALSWPDGDTDATEGFAAGEAVYRSFAEDQYLELSEDGRAAVDRLFFDESTWDASQPASVASVASRIRAMLETLASYTEDPPALPQEESFLIWFLEEAREGNSAYFSTAAVMAFRAQGIPARYVEGYLAPAEQLDGAQDGAAELTAGDAHAWVEVYVDGAGWSTVEVTPGFYQQLYSTQDVIEVNQQTAGGGDDAPQAGAVGGDMPDRETARREASPLLIAGTVLAVIAALAAAFALAVIVFEVRRAIVRRRREARCASDDQSVAVPALFEDAVRLMLAGNVAVDPARPYEAAASVEQAFPSVARDEYERAVALMQKSVFGGRELRAHEMRVLRRFNERLRHDLRPPENIRGMLVQRYRLGV